MSAGGPADSVYKSSEASPLGDLLARINQAPVMPRHTSAGLSNQSEGEWPQGYCTSTRQKARSDSTLLGRNASP